MAFNRSVALLLPALLLSAASHGLAEAKRIVVVKVDGLPGWYVEQAIAAGSAPWIDHVFNKEGVRAVNFYSRGISLSVPSWQVLDTGLPAQIHGNAEFDRYSSHVYDYLNFFPFYLDYSRSRAADMPSVAVLDDSGMPLLLDRFAVEQRYQAFQLNQRGVRLRALPRALTVQLQGRAPRELLGEWQAGFSFGQGVFEQMERELIAKLQDPNVRYLDFFSGDFDHQTHLTMDAFSHAATFAKIDKLVGRLYQAIQKAPLAEDTVLVLVSDHGMNTSPGIYSQGYSLVNYFNSAAGGGHHVVTNRHVLQEYKLMGLDPWVHRVTTASDQSPYLAGRHKQYPTVLLDLDGNERASVYFRNNHLNRLHMALLKRQYKLALRIIESQRDNWTRALANLQLEIARLRGEIQKESPKKVDDSDPEIRRLARLNRWRDMQTHYERYADSLERILQLDLDRLASRRDKIEDLIHPGAMGELNTPEDLQSYAVELRDDGTFRTIDYLAALMALRTRNEVQKDVSPYPIDFLAMQEKGGEVLVYAGPDKRARITVSSEGLRYKPLDGWKPGLPLRLLEDPEFRQGREWLEQPHSEHEWLVATHRTKYSVGVIGLAEQFNTAVTEQRAAARADLFIHANDHWNFNTRSFNPGGNHGGFFRISTHATLMFWGGAKTGVAKGVRLDEPCDGLSFVPTVLELLGLPRASLRGIVLPITAPGSN